MKQLGASNDQRLRERQRGFSFEALPEGEIEVVNPTSGMITSLPLDKVPPGSWLRLRNARTRESWVGRRPGTGVVGTKPNANPILRLITFISESGDANILRLTDWQVHHSPGGGVWTQLATDLNGVTTRFDVARMFDWMFFANGEEKLRVYKHESQTLLTVEDAPVAATVTNFGDRIVAANLKLAVGGVRPNMIAWSENSDPFDWSGIGAGSEDLVQGGGGYGDEIVRLFGLANEMVILRRRSIWHADRQPFAQAPFRFHAVISGVGCDLPHTATEAEGGIIFADQRTKSVYFYAPGARPQKISHQIDKDLFLDLKNLRWARGTYDPYEKEYHLGLCTSTLTPWITKTWVYSIERQAWSFDDSPTVSEMAVISAPASVVTIDQLVGIIDAQAGSIDDLNPGSEVLKPTLYKGTATGEFIVQSFDYDTDWDGSAFEFEAVSQNHGSPSKRRTMKDLLVKVVTDLRNAVITLEHSVNSTNWRNTKTNTFLASPNEQGARLPKKLTTGPKLYWRVRCSQGAIRIYGFWSRILEKGRQR